MISWRIFSYMFGKQMNLDRKNVNDNTGYISNKKLFVSQIR